MPEQLNATDLELRQRAGALADRICREVDPQSPNGREQVRSMAQEAGVFDLAQPVSHGGQGANALTLVAVRDEIASRNVPFAGAVFGPGPGVLAGCSSELDSAYLQPMLRGEKHGGFGFTEPDDAPRHTWAVRDGDSYRVTGAKSYVTGGGSADFVNTLVDIEDEGKALLVIDTHAPGVSITRRFSSLDGSSHAAFAFEGVRVPVSHRIGEAGGGLKRSLGQIGDTRLLIAADCVGLGRWVIDFLTKHLQAPHPSGATLGSREGVRLRYGALRAEVFSARATLYRAARLASSGERAVNEVMMAKLCATEMIGRVVDGAIQLAGGNATVADHPLAQLYQRVRSLRLAEGASDVLLLNIARGALDLDSGLL